MNVPHAPRHGSGLPSVAGSAAILALASAAFGDICTSPHQVLTQNADPSIVPGAAIACIDWDVGSVGWSSDNVFARVFELTTDIDVTCMEIGIEENTSPLTHAVTMTLRRYTGSHPFAPSLADTTIVDQVTVQVPFDFGPARVSSILPAGPHSFSAGEVIIAEFGWQAVDPDVDPPGYLLPGCNYFPQTGPTWMRSEGCGLTDYWDLDDIFPGVAVIIDLYGLDTCCNCDITGPITWVPDGACDALDFLLLQTCSTCPDINCDGVSDEDDVRAWICLFNGFTPEQCCFGTECFSDTTGPNGPGSPNGIVDSVDFLLQIAEWGSPCRPTDVDPTGPGPEDTCFTDVTGPGGAGVPDGNVDALDRLLLLAEWGSPCHPAPPA